MNRPKLFERTPLLFWNDPYISAQMFKAHLDPLTDAASRRPEVIRRTVDWLETYLKLDSNHRILDLGCGPGLYCEHFSEKKIQVTGVDYSERSIAYAKENALKKKLYIDYRLQNYLELNDVRSFDVIFLIYDDFAALTDGERSLLLTRIHKALKPKGKFVFDVRTMKHFESLKEEATQSFHPQNGFWQSESYQLIKEIILYPECDTDLTRYTIKTLGQADKVYHIWNRSFSQESIACLLNNHGFKVQQNWADLAGTPFDPNCLEMGIVASLNEDS